MNTTTTATQEPVYTVIDGEVVGNEECQELIKAFSKLKKKKLAMGASHVGAIVLEILIKAPWVQSFTLKTFPGWQYSYETGSYCIVVGNVADLTFTPEHQELARKLTWREDHLAELIETLNAYTRIHMSLYNDFDNRDEGLFLEIDRSKVQSLLDADDLSGTKAFSRLFPDRAEELGINI